MKKTLIGLMMSVLILSGCSHGPATNDVTTDTGSTANQPVEKRVVKIGVIAPLNGPVSIYGEDMINVTKTSIEEFNNSSSLIKIDLIVEDSNCNGRGAMSAAQKLITIDKVVAIGGITCDVDDETIGPIINKYKIPTLATLAAISIHDQKDDYRFSFFSNRYGGMVLADFLNNKSDDVIVILENYQRCTDTYNNFVKYFSGDDQRIKKVIKFEEGEKDMSIIAKQLASYYTSGAYILALTASPESTISLTKAIQKEKMRDTIKNKFINNSNVYAPLYLDAIGTGSDNVLVLTRISETLLKGKEYVNTFKKNFSINTDETTVLMYKESIDLIIDAINSGNYDNESIKNYFKSINKEKPRQGYFGEYYFDENGDGIGIKFIIQQIQSGQVVVIE